MVSCEDVVQAIHLLKNGKSDGLDLFSEHLKYACSAISDDLSIFFTACLRHCFLPKCIRDCVIVQDTSNSNNYRPITVASVKLWNTLLFCSMAISFRVVIYNLASLHYALP